METDRVTQCYLIDDEQDRVLFLHRNHEGDFHYGKYVGLGGHFELGETSEECIKREVFEETGKGIKILKPSLRAILRFNNEGRTFHGKPAKKHFIVYTFIARAYTGQIGECDEGELVWVPKERIYEQNLHEGDKMFLPKIFNGDATWDMTFKHKGDRISEYTAVKIR